MIAIRIGMALHAVAALAYWITQPRGFELVSRSFVEHQVVAPILFAVSAAGTAALVLNRRWTAWISVGILCGYWITLSAVIAVLGSTLASRIFWPGLIVSIGVLVLAFRRVRPEPPALLTGGTVLGIGLACMFWFATRAPPATTGPLRVERTPNLIVVEDATLNLEGIPRISVGPRGIDIRSPSGKSAFVRPAFDYSSVSESGLWTIFQHRSSTLPPWKAGRSKDGGLAFQSENEDFLSSGWIWVEGHTTIHIRCETTVKRELASHLSSVMEIDIPGFAEVRGIPWDLDHTHDRTEFVAFRNGRTEFLRAASLEKGPFETVASWEIRDPQLTIGGWKVRVLGWADQGSHEPSPTAGWGVSQAAIERVGSAYFWSLASTSIGRGWHTVRTAPGVYVLEAVLTPP